MSLGMRYMHRSRENMTPREPEIISSPVTDVNPPPQNPKNGFPEVTIVVVGEESAGKSSFIKCALDMKSPPQTTSSKKKMSLDGLVYIVYLLEVALTQVQFDRDNRIIWPRTGSELSAPNVDGVLVLHDATKPARLSLTTNLICMLLPWFAYSYQVLSS